MDIVIRTEQEADYSSVHKLVAQSFAALPVAGGDEQDFVASMRMHQGYLPELALVAEAGGRLAGYIMLTRTEVIDQPAVRVLLLAPLSVHPDFWKKGVGSALMREAFIRAERLGYEAVFLAGDPAYYGRFGFQSVTNFGIRHQLPVPDKFILARELAQGSLKEKNGTIVLTGHTTCAPLTGLL